MTPDQAVSALVGVGIGIELAIVQASVKIAGAILLLVAVQCIPPLREICLDLAGLIKHRRELREKRRAFEADRGGWPPIPKPLPSPPPPPAPPAPAPRAKRRRR